MRYFFLFPSAFIVPGGGSVGENRFDFRRVAAFDGRFPDVEAAPKDGRAPGLDTAGDTAYSSSLTPVLPDHIRKLSTRTGDNATIVYAPLNRNNGAQTDCLAAGSRLPYEGRPRFPRFPVFTSGRGILIEGAEPGASSPPQIPVTGAATCIDASGGLYARQYGSRPEGTRRRRGVRRGPGGRHPPDGAGPPERSFARAM